MTSRIAIYSGDRQHSFAGVPIDDLTIEEAVEVIHHLGGALQREADENERMRAILNPPGSAS